MNIIVLNLPRDLTQEALEELFKAHGSVTSCTIVMDKETGTSKGFGFVEMNSEEEANTAINTLHGTKIGKNKIRVKVAEERK